MESAWPEAEAQEANVITIMLADHGRYLSSRYTARAVRDVVDPSLKRREPVRFDLAGVESVTESFMHELLRPPADIGPADFFKLVSVSHCAPVIVETIRFVVADVLQSQRGPVFA